MPAISATFKLLRLPNAVIAGVVVILGGALSTWSLAGTMARLVLAAAAAALIAAGGNAHNDYCDRKLDRAQKPQRPLPSGVMTPQAAIIWTAICFSCGNLLSALLGWLPFLIGLGASALLLIYNRFLKGIPLVGNLAVALVASASFIYGGVVVGGARLVLWAAWLSLLFHLGREIIKDMEDREGDAAAGARTIPAAYGLRAARCWVSGVFLLLAISLPLPYYLGGLRSAYLIIALAGVFPVIMVIALAAWYWSQAAQFRLLSVILKLDMLIGMCALYAGRPLPS